MKLHKNAIDLSGKKFGMLKVVEPYDKTKKGMRWLCKCDCGNKSVVRSDHLRSGHSKSCGCQKIKFGKGIIKQTYERKISI